MSKSRKQKCRKKSTRRQKKQQGGSKEVQQLGRLLESRISFDEKQTKALEFLDANPRLDPNENWVAMNGYHEILLSMAVEKYLFNVATKLLSMGANVNQKTSDSGKTPLIFNSRYSKWHVVPPGYTPKDRIKFLLDNSADPNIVDKGGNTALHEAVDSDSMEIIEELVNRGADVNIQNNDGQAPINIGPLRPEYAKFLIEHDADVNTKSNDGRTPIHWTSSYANINTARILIENGANIEEPFGGKTPLLMSLDRYESDNIVNINYVKLLLQYRANVDAKNRRGEGVDYYIDLIERGIAGEDEDEIEAADRELANNLRKLIEKARQYPERLGVSYLQKKFNKFTNKAYGAPPGTFSIPIKNKIGKYLGHNKN